MPGRVQKALPPRFHAPLRRVALCLDCDECFDVACTKCPACGGETWASLARFLEIAPSESLSQVFTKARGKAAASRDDERQMVRHLFIVARNRVKLFEFVKRALAGNETVEVVLDRRQGERRQLRGVPPREQRRRERRLSPAEDDQMRAIGWTIALRDLIQHRRGPARIPPRRS